MILLVEILCLVGLQSLSADVAINSFPGFAPVPANAPLLFNPVPVYPGFVSFPGPIPAIQPPFPGVATSYGFNQLPPAVITTLSPFALQFYQAASSSNILPKLFDLSLTPSQAGNAFFDSSLAFGQKLNVPNVLTNAQSVSQAAAKAFGNITHTDFFKASTNSIERFLASVGILTPYNVPAVVNAYVSSLEDAARSVGPSPSPQQSIAALGDGTSNFLKAFNLPSDQIASLISIFADELNSV